MRPAIACLILSMLASCSTEAPLSDRLASRDVLCLHHQVYDLDTPFKDAVGVYGVAKPDLTGSGGLQQAALAANVPFTIRPEADAYLNQAQAEQVTGHLIPYPNAGAGYTPRNGVMPTSLIPGGP